MADKRIYELQETTADLDAFIAFDKLGFTEAKKTSIQGLIDIIQSNVSASTGFSTGSTNPDNSVGNDGDIYFKITSNRLDFYQKVSGAWGNVGVFEVTSGGGGGTTPLSFDQTDLVSMGEGFYKIPLVLTGTQSVLAVKISIDGGDTYQKPASDWINDEIINFDSNATQTITVIIS